jgi:hypothetical protein
MAFGFLKFSEMTRLFILATLGFIVLNLSAQTSSDSVYLKPRRGNLGITLNLSGLINNLQIAPPTDPAGNILVQGRYYVRDAHVVTFGVGFQTINSRISTVDSVGSGQAKFDSTYKQNKFFISPGYEFHFLETKRLDPYIGGAVHLGFIGKQKETGINEFVDTTGTAKTTVDFTQDGGFQFGFMGVVGFNFFVAKNFSMGAEYRFGFTHLRSGGDFEQVISNTPVSGTATSQRIVGSRRTAMSGLSMQSNAAITLSYFFGRKEDRYLPK